MAHEWRPCLLSDSSVLFRFFAAGVDVIDAFMRALGDRLYIVFDVQVEIDRHKNGAEFGEGARRFLELLQHEPIVLDDELRDQASRVLSLNKRLGMRDEDRGEVATVIYARSRIREGEEWLVLVADRYGIDLAEAADEVRVPTMNTTDTVIDLVCQGALTDEEGELVWIAVHGSTSTKGFRAKLDEVCPEEPGRKYPAE